MKFFITEILLGILLGTSNIKTMTMKLTKRDVRPLADHNAVKYNVSLIYCAEICHRSSLCNSLTYKTGTCSLYEKGYSEDDTQLESAEGSMYYSIYANPVGSITALPSITTGRQENIKAFKEEDSITWYEAKINCKNEGGNLVSILTEEIQKQVVEAMEKVNDPDGSWIGLRGINKYNDYQWLEGTILRGVLKGTKTDDPYQNWHPDNPDDSDKDTPVRILGSKYGEGYAYTWSDQGHHDLFNSYVCEFNP